MRRSMLAIFLANEYSGRCGAAAGADFPGRGDVEPDDDHRARYRGQEQGGFPGGHVPLCEAVCSGGGG